MCLPGESPFVHASTDTEAIGAGGRSTAPAARHARCKNALCADCTPRVRQDYGGVSAAVFLEPRSPTAAGPPPLPSGHSLRRRENQAGPWQPGGSERIAPCAKLVPHGLHTSRHTRQIDRPPGRTRPCTPQLSELRTVPVKLAVNVGELCQSVSASKKGSGANTSI